MNSLKLKIPPLILVVIFATIMWVLSFYFSVEILPQSLNIILTTVILLMGVAISLAGVFSFKQSKTTVNPTKPEETSSLVTSGVYKFTRNPMYVGFLLFLVSFAVYLSSLASLIISIFFVLYMNKFQIKPEEEMLSNLFGKEFDIYKQKVRRWV